MTPVKPRSAVKTRKIYGYGWLVRALTKIELRKKKVVAVASTRQVVLPESLRKYVMSSAHDTTTGGHLGIKKTREKIMSNFYWPGIYKDVARYCGSCDVCQKTLRNETSSKSTRGLEPDAR